MAALIDVAKQGVVKNFEISQEISPVILIVDQDKRLTAVGISSLFSEDIPREVRRVKLGELLSELSAEEYALITESWIGRYDPGVALSGQFVAPSQLAESERGEAVLISYQKRGSRASQVILAEIDRTGDKPKLGEFSDFSQEVEGLMVGLFNKRNEGTLQ